jgi:hypothetical protein
MNSKRSFASKVLVIFTFICAVSIGTAAAQPGGHLVVLRSPNFGWNLAFNLEIDGRPVANVVQGRHYHAWLPAGKHVLTVRKVPYASLSEPTSITVNIQPGWTNVFTAMWDSNLVYLRPSTMLLSPGAIWQNRGDVY